jgi:hypothetical protein
MLRYNFCLREMMNRSHGLRFDLILRGMDVRAYDVADMRSSDRSWRRSGGASWWRRAIRLVLAA